MFEQLADKTDLHRPLTLKKLNQNLFRFVFEKIFQTIFFNVKNLEITLCVFGLSYPINQSCKIVLANKASFQYKSSVWIGLKWAVIIELVEEQSINNLL